MSERAASASHAERFRRQSERFNEDIAELLYADALQACRREGHDLEASISIDGESFTCRRCETVWEEVPK